MTKSKLPKPIKSRNPVVILRSVARVIEQEPKRYDQGTYIERAATTVERPTTDFPVCGTICCVAGWVNVLTGHMRTHYHNQSNVARRTLGLTEDEAAELFDPHPDGFGGNREDVDPEQHVEDGIRHIKRFVLKKWGKQL